MSQDSSESGNWQIVCRGYNNRSVLYNKESNKCRTIQISINEDSQPWAHSAYFKLLEDIYNIDNIRGLPPPLNIYLNDGYFSKFFPFREKITTGGSGTVYHVKHEFAGYTLADYAVKIVQFGETSRLHSALREVKFFQELAASHHPFILGYYHCWIENFQNAIEGPEVPSLFILMEYSHIGNLEDFLKKNNVDLQCKWQIILQIALALRFLHCKGILHRDLKMSNVLIIDDKDTSNPLPYKFVLCDFGTSSVAQRRDPRNRTGATGTIETMAPELFEQDDQGQYVFCHSFSSDVWSLGVIIFHLFFGKNPFAGNNGEELLKHYTDVDMLLTKLGIYEHDVPSDIMSLIQSMMKKNTYNRITLSQFFEHPSVSYYIHHFHYENFAYPFQQSPFSVSKKPFVINSPEPSLDEPVILPDNYIRLPDPTQDSSHNVMKNSFPLSLTYSDHSFHRYFHYNSHFNSKLFIILLMALCCIHFPSLIYYFIHFLLIAIIAMVYLKCHYCIYFYPLMSFVEVLLFSNSFFIVLLILTITIFIENSQLSIEI